MKSGFIGIIGRPNVGKSTLLNSILGEKIAITTNKPQTTRNTIRGIYTEGEGNDTTQMVFIDTPGIHKGRTKLGENITKMSLQTLNEVDLILLLVDGPLDKGPGDKYILDLIKDLRTPKILLINKIDTMSPDEYLKIYNQYDELKVMNYIMGISAKTNSQIPALIKLLKSMMNDGPMYFPKDMITDNPERFLVSELVREKILSYLDDEVPHGVAVEIESYKEEENLTRIGVVIYCEKKSHKGIIIGHQGKKLKGIGKSARLEIEALLGVKVYLNTWVKVKENWRDSDIAISNFGYKPQC